MFQSTNLDKFFSNFQCQNLSEISSEFSKLYFHNDTASRAVSRGKRVLGFINYNKINR